MADTGPAIFQCSNTDRTLDDLVTVGADRGARAVVLKRAGPAGRRTSGRRNGLDNGEQNARARVILVNMVDLLVLKPEAASAD